MVWEGTRGQNMRTNRLSHIYIYIYKSSMNTVLLVNATIGFSENLFLVFIVDLWVLYLMLKTFWAVEWRIFIGHVYTNITN